MKTLSLTILAALAASVAMLALVRPGDEVLMLAPLYDAYLPLVEKRRAQDWSDADKEREVSQFKAHTQAELEAEAAVTDREANDILVRAGSARPTQNEV